MPSIFFPRGVGNTVSREFNLLYRFHSIQSENEIAWTTGFIEKMFPGQDVPNLSSEQFFAGLIKWMMAIPDDPLKRTLNDLVRNEDGSYNDGDLMAILRGAIDDPAGMWILSCPWWTGRLTSRRRFRNEPCPACPQTTGNRRYRAGPQMERRLAERVPFVL